MIDGQTCFVAVSFYNPNPPLRAYEIEHKYHVQSIQLHRDRKTFVVHKRWRNVSLLKRESIKVKPYMLFQPQILVKDRKCISCTTLKLFCVCNTLVNKSQPGFSSFSFTKFLNQQQNTMHTLRDARKTDTCRLACGRS